MLWQIQCHCPQTTFFPLFISRSMSSFWIPYIFSFVSLLHFHFHILSRLRFKICDYLDNKACAASNFKKVSGEATKMPSKAFPHILEGRSPQSLWLTTLAGVSKLRIDTEIIIFVNRNWTLRAQRIIEFFVFDAINDPHWLLFDALHPIHESPHI